MLLKKARELTIGTTVWAITRDDNVRKGIVQHIITEGYDQPIFHIDIGEMDMSLRRTRNGIFSTFTEACLVVVNRNLE